LSADAPGLGAASRFILISDPDFGARVREGFRQRRANTRSRAGDQGRFVLETKNDKSILRFDN
jgi:hypothetical protein